MSARRITVLPAAAAGYVAAWIAGLLIMPSAPAGAVELHAHIAAHRTGTVLQSLLVHGVAGIALAVIGVSLGRLAARRAAGRLPALISASALTAAAASLAQVAILLTLVAGLPEGSVDRTVAMRGWIDTVDAGKLVALAVFAVTVAAAGRGSGLLPRWVLAPSAVLAGLLTAGAVSFAVPVPGLTLLLYVSLPALLIWVFTVAVRATRAERAPGR